MLEIFNTKAITRKQRFTKALVFGILVSLGLIVAYILAIKLFQYILSDVVYIAFGYLIALTVREMGRGVQKQFSILAAVLTIVVIVSIDLVISGGDLRNLLDSLTYGGLYSLLSIGYRVLAVYIAYGQARVVGR